VPAGSADARTSVSAGKGSPFVTSSKSPTATSRQNVGLNVLADGLNLPTLAVFTALSSRQRFKSSYKSFNA